MPPHRSLQSSLPFAPRQHLRSAHAVPMELRQIVPAKGDACVRAGGARTQLSLGRRISGVRAGVGSTSTQTTFYVEGADARYLYAPRAPCMHRRWESRRRCVRATVVPGMWTSRAAAAGLWLPVCVCVCVCVRAYVHVWMYACMHVMYVCILVCMHVCMHACMHACLYVCMRAWMNVCMPARMHACMHDACMHIYMHIRRFVPPHTSLRCTRQALFGFPKALDMPESRGEGGHGVRQGRAHARGGRTPGALAHQSRPCRPTTRLVVCTGLALWVCRACPVSMADLGQTLQTYKASLVMGTGLAL